MYESIYCFIVPYAIRPQVIFSEKTKKDLRRMKSYDETSSDKAYYKPPLHADEIGLTSDKYVSLNNTIDFLPLKVSYASMSMQV